MHASLPREKNPNWRGGRYISSHGYIKILLAPGDPRADSKGYAYEHRIVAEEKIGRPLNPGEIIHHINGIRTDNQPENIMVTSGAAEHHFYHRKKNSDLTLPGEDNPIRQCECGCGVQFYTYDETGRPRKYVSGHNLREGRIR